MNHATVDVTGVEILDGHRVRIGFSDGQWRERDLGPLLTGPVFDAIRQSPAEFRRVSVDTELGVLCWPNGTDIDAELLRYDDLWNDATRLARSA